MKPSLVVVFDNAPEEQPAAPPWMLAVCTSTQLTWLSNEKIIEEFSNDKDVQNKVMDIKGVPWGSNPMLAKNYAAAMEKVAAGKSRRALYGVNWVEYAPKVDACILDLAAIDNERKKGIAKGVAQKAADDYYKTYSKQMKDRAVAKLGEAKVLVFQPGEPAAKKQEAAVAFLKKLDG